jgi:gamma-glutamyltranspeptidase/glutathione hydrolase
MTRRREFLTYAAAGIVAARTVRAARLSDTERRKLVAEARFGRKKAASGKNGVVVCSHPLASHAGVEMLKSGGNACDAACTAAITQTVVEPHMTTITGVFSMLYYDAKTGKTTYMNGGMNVPKAGLAGYSGADLKTGRGCGVPGWWAGFEAALGKHGSKAKSEVMATAIGYARDGFEVHPFPTCWPPLAGRRRVVKFSCRRVRSWYRARS